ncbi:STAS-like domain-containing protein [Variovorax paradoxus]|jgi:hypothetical protein|uniref:STAS-like domain-containing protein n=1 Tax=Variovorax paradoxus TaxID=34073 RepID=UPI00339ACE61
MAGVRENGEKVREFLLQGIVEKDPQLVTSAVRKFSISRQAVLKHVDRLKAQNAILVTGTKRKPIYELIPIQVVERDFLLQEGLEEHDVWEELVLPLINSLPANVLGIWIHAFTEMFNNAIDHSGGKSIHVRVTLSAQATEIQVSDDGIGIFKKIQGELDLQDERHALFELSKGKLTTDPKNHSGEGIFFTSRMLDRFEILAGGLFYVHRRDFNYDWLVGESRPQGGTLVTMALSNHSAMTSKKTFDQFSSKDGEYGFNKTVIPIALAQFGSDSLVSRSQAKRILVRADKFEHVVFNFSDVTSIGQAFADQIFRVYANEHPAIQLTPVNMNADVRQMVERAKAARQEEKAPKFSVIVTADGSSIEQVEAARHSFESTLLAALGFPKDVTPFLRAWANQQRGDTLTPLEAAQAAAWSTARTLGEIEGNAKLQNPNGTFTVRLLFGGKSNAPAADISG